MKPLCERCLSEIQSGGYAYVDAIEMNAILTWQDEQETARWERIAALIAAGESVDDARRFSGVSLADVMGGPGDARWHVVHDGCLGEDAAPFYEVSLDECRNAKEILSWTAHLSEKTWFSETNWFDFVARTFPNL